jgi:hypothetical protein
MGKYFNPATKEALMASGRKLDPMYNIKDYDSYKKLLKDDEVLVGLFDRAIFKVAPVIPDADEYEEFMKQYRAGQFISFDFFAVPASKIP